jgi:hypothetical protein
MNNKEREVKQGEFYKHFKNKLYQIIAIASHSETREKMVVYQALYGDFGVYVRPYDMFISEVDHEKYPDVLQKYRFEKCDVNLEFRNDQNITNEVSENMDVKEDTKVVSIESVQVEETIQEEGQISPLLLEFLECDTFEEKLDKFLMMKSKVDDRLLNDIAMSLDIIVDSKSLADKYEEIKGCLLTFVRFEDNRIR